MNGYAEAPVLARKLDQSFRFFDTDNSGTIDYNEFFAAMVRLNFIGVQVSQAVLVDSLK